MFNTAKSLLDMEVKRLQILIDLIKSDFRKKYLGSYLGVVWAFLNPLITILIFLLIFQVGFKSPPVDQVPFAIWLTVGIAPWFYFSDALINATHSIYEYGFLVKKVVFQIILLPVIRVLTALIIHFFLIIVVLIMLTYSNNHTTNFSWPFLYWLQILYYIFAETVLLIALAWPLAAANVFIKDTGNFINMIMQFLFWSTPILWKIEILPERYQTILKLNPIYYIINGQRESLLYGKWFWQDPLHTIFFWSFTLIILFVGLFIFKKARPYFADVL
ncbi:MAG: ABC transporter permease [Oligoflexia bacterium]|nr:ABC transporter permease [Oligoflexia bacterium]